MTDDLTAGLKYDVILEHARQAGVDINDPVQTTEFLNAFSKTFLDLSTKKLDDAALKADQVNQDALQAELVERARGGSAALQTNTKIEMRERGLGNPEPLKPSDPRYNAAMNAAASQAAGYATHLVKESQAATRQAQLKADYLAELRATRGAHGKHPDYLSLQRKYTSLGLDVNAISQGDLLALVRK